MIGERLKRIEDPALLRGAAVFVDDIHLAGMLHAAFVRSPHPHALIKGINTTAAKSYSGVIEVYTLQDFRPYIEKERLPLQFPLLRGGLLGLQPLHRYWLARHCCRQS